MKIKLCLILLALILIPLCFTSCQISSGDPTFTIDANGYLIANYPNGSSQVVGAVRPADGKDGADGKGITTATVNDKGELILTFSDGMQSNLGNIIGKDGKDGKDGLNGSNGQDGKDGLNGSNGQDGVGIESIEIREGQLYITYTNGQTVPLGKVVGEDGRGIRTIRLINGIWYIRYTDGTLESVTPETNNGGIIDGDPNTESGWGELVPVTDGKTTERTDEGDADTGWGQLHPIQ